MGRKRKATNFDEIKIITPKDDTRWSDGDMLNLIIAVQRYGLSECGKIAEVVKTKSENAIKNLLDTEVKRARRELAAKEGYKLRVGCRGGSWHHPNEEELKRWPPVRKWRKIINNQLLPCVKKNDYSKILMQELFQSFYDEAEETDNPQVVNVKAVYKFLLDSVRGIVPAELSPLDSGVVLLLLGQLKDMQNELDFDEEKKFIKGFKRAKPFAPIKVKEEFREATKKRTADLQNAVKVSKSSASDDPGEGTSKIINLDGEQVNEKASVKVKEEVEDKDAIMVVEEMFAHLSKHRKLVQSFNPLNVPMWSLVKEQGYIQNKCELGQIRFHLKKEPQS